MTGEAAGHIPQPLSEAFKNSVGISAFFRPGVDPGVPATKLAILVAMTLALSLPGRAESPPTRTPHPPKETDPDVTLVLRAMNTSRERPSIDLEVTIDGVVAVRDRLSSEGKKGFSIPPSKTFPLRLSAGKHRLHAASSEASASLDREFEILKKKHWALLSYEPGPDKVYRFAWTFQEEPIYFQ